MIQIDDLDGAGKMQICLIPDPLRSVAENDLTLAPACGWFRRQLEEFKARPIWERAWVYEGFCG